MPVVCCRSVPVACCRSMHCCSMLPFNALLLVPCCLLPLSALLPFAVQYTVCCRSIHCLLSFNTLFVAVQNTAVVQHTLLPFNTLFVAVQYTVVVQYTLLPFNTLFVAVQYTLCCRSIHCCCRSVHYLLQMNELLSALLYVLVNEPVQFPAVAHIASCFSCFLNS